MPTPTRATNASPPPINHFFQRAMPRLALTGVEVSFMCAPWGKGSFSWMSRSLRRQQQNGSLDQVRTADRNVRTADPEQFDGQPLGGAVVGLHLHGVTAIESRHQCFGRGDQHAGIVLQRERDLDGASVGGVLDGRAG